MSLINKSDFDAIVLERNHLESENRALEARVEELEKIVNSPLVASVLANTKVRGWNSTAAPEPHGALENNSATKRVTMTGPGTFEISTECVDENARLRARNEKLEAVVKAARGVKHADECEVYWSEHFNPICSCYYAPIMAALAELDKEKRCGLCTDGKPCNSSACPNDREKDDG